jgi:hypothetical protein
MSTEKDGGYKESEHSLFASSFHCLSSYKYCDI